MSLLEESLARMGEAQLQELLGDEVSHMLSRLGEKTVTTRALSQLIRNRDPERLLLDKAWREELIFALPEQAAESIAERLGLNPSNDPWESIASRSFRRGSQDLETLAKALEIELPELDSDSARLPDLEVAEPQYGLFRHQRRAARELNAVLTSDCRRAILHMPTGSGKTRTAMNVIAQLLRDVPNGLVIWLAHSEELCDQASKEFEQAWGFLGDRPLPLARLYSYHEPDLESVDGGLLVAGLQKFYSRALRKQSDVLGLKRNLALVVMDEAHQAIAPTYEHVLTLMTPDERGVPILGLTATPGRGGMTEGESEELADFFCRNKVSLEVEGYDNPIDFLQTEGYLASPSYEYLEVDADVRLGPEDFRRIRDGFDLTADTLVELASDEVRNLAILERTLETAEQGYSIIVFACSVAHSEFLADVLNLRNLPSASITSTTAAAVRRQALRAFRNGELKVLTNYGVLTTGFDAPQADCAIVARPTQSVVLYSQMIGRVLRGPKAGGTSTCRIVTVVDRMEGFRNIYEGFSHWEELW